MAPIGTGPPIALHEDEVFGDVPAIFRRIDADSDHELQVGPVKLRGATGDLKQAEALLAIVRLLAVGYVIPYLKEDIGLSVIEGRKQGCIPRHAAFQVRESVRGLDHRLRERPSHEPRFLGHLRNGAWAGEDIAISHEGSVEGVLPRALDDVVPQPGNPICFLLPQIRA